MRHFRFDGNDLIFAEKVPGKLCCILVCHTAKGVVDVWLLEARDAA